MAEEIIKLDEEAEEEEESIKIDSEELKQEDESSLQNEMEESVNNVTAVISADELKLQEIIRPPVMFEVKSNFKVLKKVVTEENIGILYEPVTF